MKPITPLTSTCRYCRYYQPEGRRGGQCHKLSAPVEALWKACPLALPAFSTYWETLEDAWSLPVATPVVLDNLPTAKIEEVSVRVGDW